MVTRQEDLNNYQAWVGNDKPVYCNANISYLSYGYAYYISYNSRVGK